MDELVLAVDIGTSSLKASLIDARGTIRAAARCRFPQGPRLAKHWTDAWFEAVNELCARLDACHPAASRAQRRVVAVSVSGNGPTLVAVDQAGNAGPLLLWNDPIPAEDSAAATAGAAPRSLFIPRISAYRTLNPHAWNDARFVLSGPEYLIWFLTGRAVTILPEVRYLDAYWTSESLARAGLDPEKLATFVEPGTVAGTLSGVAQPAADRSSDRLLPAGTPVIAGGPDFIVALVGTGTLEPGKACDRAGTSEGLNVCTDVPVRAAEIRTLPSVMAGLWNASYLLPETGAMFHAWRNANGKADMAYPDIMREIERGRDSGGRDLVDRIGESVKHGVDTLKAATGMNPVYALSGGQARNDIWNQMKADMTGATFALTATPDGELMGDAIIAFASLGSYGTLKDAARSMVRVIRHYECNPEKHAIYMERISKP
jgi:xylulokinase